MQLRKKKKNKIEEEREGGGGACSAGIGKGNSTRGTRQNEGLVVVEIYNVLDTECSAVKRRQKLEQMGNEDNL